MTHLRIKIVFVALIVVATCVFVVRATMTTRHAASVASSPLSSDTWETIIRSDGIEVARQKVIVAWEQNTARHHSLLHAFGAAAYRVAGGAAFTACDRRDNDACEHGIIIEAMRISGKSAVPQLLQDCSSIFNAMPCGHGIGHGLLVMTDRSPKALLGVLDSCMQSLDSDPAGHGCVGGAVMEFNEGTARPDGRVIRDFDATYPYWPCQTLPEQYRNNCYMPTTEWWYYALTQSGLSSTTTLQKMGDMCRALPDKKYAYVCWMTIGESARQASARDWSGIRELCGVATHSSYERSQCLFGAIRMIAIDGNSKDALAYCKEVRPEDQQTCRDVALHGAEATVKPQQ